MRRTATSLIQLSIEDKELFWSYVSVKSPRVPHLVQFKMPPEVKAKCYALEKNSNFGSKSKMRFEKALGKSKYVREYTFCEHRKWRFDYAFPQHFIAFEWDGGIFFSKSAHNSAPGIMRDNEKRNMAQILGWRVFNINAGGAGVYNVLRFIQDHYNVKGFNLDLPFLE